MILWVLNSKHMESSKTDGILKLDFYYLLDMFVFCKYVSRIFHFEYLQPNRITDFCTTQLLLSISLQYSVFN